VRRFCASILRKTRTRDTDCECVPASHRYWSRTPTGTEFLAEIIIAVNGGARGSVSWKDPTTPSIRAAASAFAHALPELIPFVLKGAPPLLSIGHLIRPDGLDVGMWVSEDGSKMLAMICNPNDSTTSISLNDLLAFAFVNYTTSVGYRMVLDGGGRIMGSEIVFDSVQSGIWIFG
jgi:hypothetical protein